jgi:hypothetical protein
LPLTSAIAELVDTAFLYRRDLDIRGKFGDRITFLWRSGFWSLMIAGCRIFSNTL